MRFMSPRDRLLWWRRGSTSSLTPGTATVTLNPADTSWSPSSVPGANPAGGPLVFRVYGAGGNGGLPEEGIGGAGGGGGAFQSAERATWSASDEWDVSIGAGGSTAASTISPHGQPENGMFVNGGNNASGIVPGTGGDDGAAQGAGWSNVSAFTAGGNGGASGSAIAGGGGSSGSIGGAGVAGDNGGSPTNPVTADGGAGGYGGDGDIGGDGQTPGGGGGGTGDGGGGSAAVGGNGRIVILVPTLT